MIGVFSTQYTRHYVFILWIQHHTLWPDRCLLSYQMFLKRKFKQWFSTMSSISTKRSITFSFFQFFFLVILFLRGGIVVVIVWYLCNQCLSPLMLWFWITLRWDVFDTTLCVQVCQWLAAGQRFSLGAPVSSINKTDCHYITEILLKVVLNTITINTLSTS